MPNKSHDNLEGKAPDKCDTALVLVDVINAFDFSEAEKLLPRAIKAASKLAPLKARARKAGVPCIYVNDNYGRWRSDFRSQVDRCLEEQCAGRPIASLLQPSPDDYFVLKPKHSAFYQTCLALLLEHLGARTLVIGGFATDSCVMFTATDAYLRGHELVVPTDGTAARHLADHRSALRHMQRSLHARVVSCAQIAFSRPSPRAGRMRAKA